MVSDIFQFMPMLALIALGAADEPTCQTSPGSPRVLDCSAAIDNVSKDIGDGIGNEDCVLPNIYFHDAASKSKCQTMKKHGSCKIDLCFVGSTGGGAVQKTHVVDIAKKLLTDAGCGRYVVDGDNQGLKIGSYYRIDNPSDGFANDAWCRAPKESMKVQFSKS
ncbi:hypothetical protein F4818DRAFT_440164 [Hypoxylon cercidicola]|nr:hypothetical protein F4818DRAFT_440164 [Hypoxylon cercidicola]